MMNKEYYWYVDNFTGEVSQDEIEAIFRGGIYHMPENALTIKPLPKRTGSVVIINDDHKGTHYESDFRGRKVWNCDDCNNSVVVDYIGDIKEGFTLNEPVSHFDKWVKDKWVKDVETSNISISDIRRNRYSIEVDPLMNEAAIKRVMMLEKEAAELEKEAVKLRKLIQEEHKYDNHDGL